LDKHHHRVYLTEKYLNENELYITIKSFSGLQEGKYLFSRANLVRIDEETEYFYYRALTILQTLDVLIICLKLRMSLEDYCE